jgi:hypothetical protein
MGYVVSETRAGAARQPDILKPIYWALGLDR